MVRPHPTGNLDNPQVAHEHSDVPMRALLIFFGVLIVLAVIIHIVVWFYMMWLQRPGPPYRGAAQPFIAEPGAPPPGPQFERLIETAQPVQQVNPVVELRIFRARERETLRQWGWEDTPAGPVMPKARALEALRAAGLLDAATEGSDR